MRGMHAVIRIKSSLEKERAESDPVMCFLDRHANSHQDTSRQTVGGHSQGLKHNERVQW